MLRKRITPDGMTRLTLDLAIDLINNVKESQLSAYRRITPQQRARLSDEWRDAQREQVRTRSWDKIMPELTELLASFFVARHGRLVESLNGVHGDFWPMWDARTQRYVMARKKDVMDDLRHESNEAFFQALARKLYREDEDAGDDGLASLCGDYFDMGNLGLRRWH